MILLRILLALAGAAVAWVLGIALDPALAFVFDPFLLVVVWYSFRTNNLLAQVVGTVAGLLHDGVTGGLYGLHALADTVVAFAVGLAARRVALGQRGVLLVLFGGSAALQQLVVLLTLWLLAPGWEGPGVSWVLAKVAVTTLLGGLLLVLEARGGRRWRTWRQSRSRRLRFD